MRHRPRASFSPSPCSPSAKLGAGAGVGGLSALERLWRDGEMARWRSREMARWRDVGRAGLWLGRLRRSDRVCSREPWGALMWGRGNQPGDTAQGLTGMSRGCFLPAGQGGRGFALPAVSAFHLPESPVERLSRLLWNQTLTDCVGIWPANVWPPSSQAGGEGRGVQNGLHSGLEQTEA